MPIDVARENGPTSPTRCARKAATAIGAQVLRRNSAIRRWTTEHSPRRSVNLALTYVVVYVPSSRRFRPDPTRRPARMYGGAFFVWGRSTAWLDRRFVVAAQLDVDGLSLSIGFGWKRTRYPQVAR